MQKFDINTWRSFYDKLHNLGATLKLYTWERYKTKSEANDAAISVLIIQIDKLHQDATIYMTQCGIESPPAKWRYDAENTKTHASHKDFAFKDLL